MTIKGNTAAAQLDLNSLPALLIFAFFLWGKNIRGSAQSWGISPHTHIYTHSYSAFTQPIQILTELIFRNPSESHSSLYSQLLCFTDVLEEKLVVRCFSFPPCGFLTVVLDAKIKGYEGRLYILPWFLLTCSIHPVFLSPFVDLGPIRLPASGLRCDTATRDGKLHSLSHPPLCLSPCSIVYPYLLGFLQSNQLALSPSLSAPSYSLLTLPPPSQHPLLYTLSLPPRYFSQRWISKIKNPSPLHSLSLLSLSVCPISIWNVGGAKEKAGHEENAHYLNETHTHTHGNRKTERVIRGMCYTHGRGKLPWQSLTWLLARGDKNYHTTAPLASSRTPWHTLTHTQTCRHQRATM